MSSNYKDRYSRLMSRMQNGLGGRAGYSALDSNEQPLVQSPVDIGGRGETGTNPYRAGPDPNSREARQFAQAPAPRYTNAAPPSYAHPGANPYERETGRSGGPAGTYAADGTFQTPRTPSQAEELHALSRLAQDAATFLWELIATSGGDLTTLDTEMQVSCAELDDKIEQLAGQIRGLVGDFDPSSSQRGEAVLAGALEALDTLQNVRTEFDDLTSIHGHTPTAAAAATRAQPPLPVSTPTGGGRVRLGGRNANWQPPGSTTNNNNNNNIIAERDVVVTPAPLPAPLPPPPPPSVKPKAKPKVIEGDLLDMSDPTPAPAPAVTGYPMGHAGYYAPPGQQVTGAGYVGGAPVPLPGPAYGVPAPQMTGGGYGYGSTTAMVPAVAPGMMPTGSNPSMATGGVLNTNKSKPQRVGYPAVSPGAAAYYVPPSATTTGGGVGAPAPPLAMSTFGFSGNTAAGGGTGAGAPGSGSPSSPLMPRAAGLQAALAYSSSLRTGGGSTSSPVVAAATSSFKVGGASPGGQGGKTGGDLLNM